MNTGPFWSRVRDVAIVFGAAGLLVLAWLVYAALKGAIEAPRVAGAITPALQRFVAATAIFAYAVQAGVCAALLTAGYWLARRKWRRNAARR